MPYTELEEGCFRLGEVLIETQYLNHTAPTIAYRLSSDGATVAYVTDHELFRNPVDRIFHHPGDQRHIDFLKGSDLIIHGAQYTQEEYPHKMGWGHSTIEYATDVALAAGSSRLALFHHNPGHDDATIRRIEEAARARLRQQNLPIILLADGPTVEGPLRNGTPAAIDYLATPFKPPMLRARVRAWLIRTSTPGDMRSDGQLCRAQRAQA
jgi:hypothetical protein